MSGGKKAWKRIHTSLRHISVNPCDRFFQSAPRKWKEKRWVVKEPQKGGCMPLRYLFRSIIGSVVLIGQTEGRKRDEQWKRNPEGGNAHHLESIPQSTPAINSSDRSARRMSGETKWMCMQPRYPNLSQLSSYRFRRKSEMSDGKEAQMVLKLLRSIPLLGQTDRRGGTRISLWLH